MDLDRSVLRSAAGAVAITVLSGVMYTRTLLGAVHYGDPLPWLVRLVLGPDQFPWRVNSTGLLLDLTAWTLVVFVPMAVFGWMSG